MTYRVQNPAFSAVAIDRLQTLISGLQISEENNEMYVNLIQDIYPEIEVSTAEETKGMAIFWLSKKDFKSVSPNDNFKSIAFFKVNDPIKTEEYFTELNIDLIVWLNTDRLQYNYRPIKHNVMGLITAVLNESPEISDISLFSEKNNVFTGELQQQNSFSLEAPYTGFRINFTYELDTCSDSSFTSNPFC